MKELLLATKFRVPRLPVQHVPRARLVALLNKGVAGSLTLVSAPAGFGKTTLLTEWARATLLPVAWLALERADSASARLLTYFRAALQTLDERIGAQEGPLPEFLSLSDSERVLSGLINDLVTYVPEDVALVLDDYHTLEGETAHALLTFWLEHAPEHVHLVLGTRVDPPLPLARLRARGCLREIHSDTLRFQMEEVEAFLRAMDLDFGAHTLQSLEQRTEGWIAGVQLAALALRGHADPAAFLEGFHGSHRFVLEYISAEILSRLEPHVRAFLLRTSILERLSGSLCDAVLERTDSQVMLEELRRANLFVSALDDTGEWYRYHSLFAESLRHQLMRLEPEHLTRLAILASRWFEEHAMLYEACEYALQARDFARAVPMMERLVNRMIGRVELSMLRRWLEQLPEEIVASRPGLRVAATWVALTNDDLQAGQLENMLNVLQQNFQGQTSQTDYTEWVEARANLHFIRIIQVLEQNRIEEALSLAGQMLQVLPENASHTRDLVGLCIRVVQGAACRLRGDFVEAEKLLLAASAHIEHEEFHFLNLVAIVKLIEMYEARGELHKIAFRYQHLFQTLRSNTAALPEMTVWVTIGYARLLLEWNRLDEASEYMRLSQVAMRTIEITELTFMTHYVHLWIYHARGQEREVQALLQVMDSEAARLGAHPACELAIQARIRLFLHRSQVEEAAHVCETSGLREDDVQSNLSDGTLFMRYTSLARVLIALARRYPPGVHLARVLALLGRLRVFYEAAQLSGRVLEILMLTALALQVKSEQEGEKSITRALYVLQQAIALARPGGFVRLFVDEGLPMVRLLTLLLARKPSDAAYIRVLLAAFESEGLFNQEIVGHVTSPRGPATTLEPLSAREREVLALLAIGSSNQEIAARLVIAPNTAKRHVKNILGKLAANNRTQAVARAREAGLLEQT